MATAARLEFGPPPASTFDVEPTADEVAFFQENGYLVVDRITTDEELAWLTEIYDFIFSDEQAAAPGAPVDRSRPMESGEPARLRQAFFPEMRFPELLDSTFRRNARRYAAALLQVDEGDVSSWGHMIRKPPHHGSPAPWHQDEAYWEPELSYHALGAWLPLHDVTVEMGCMQFVPGSHKHGVFEHHHQGEPRENKLYAVGIDTSGAVACPLKAGGATFHHQCTLHYTAPNTTDRPRLAYPIEFQVAPVRRETPADRPWVAEFRAATGGGPSFAYPADGRMVTA